MGVTGLQGIKSGPSKGAPVPLLAVQRNVTLVEAVVEVEVVQEYMNREEEAIEVVYFFPEVEGEVRQDGDAVREYEEAVDKGQTVGLLIQVKPDVLHPRLGRLGP